MAETLSMNLKAFCGVNQILGDVCLFLFTFSSKVVHLNRVAQGPPPIALGTINFSQKAYALGGRFLERQE